MSVSPPASIAQLPIQNGPVTGTRSCGLDAVCNGIHHRPRQASTLQLGVSEDGSPVLMDLAHPSSAPVLIAADAGAGKTRLLQEIARRLEASSNCPGIRFAVLTDTPGEWDGFSLSQLCDGIFSFHSSCATGYLHGAITGGAHRPGTEDQLVLLIDGLEALASDGDLRDIASALLCRPSACTAFPVITLNTAHAPWPAQLLAAFGSRVLGYMEDVSYARHLAAGAELFARRLQPPIQFVACTGNAFLPFWLADPR